MSMSTITNKDNLVVIPNNPSDAYQIGYAIGYQDGKRDAASPWHRVEEPPKEYGTYVVCWKDGEKFWWEKADWDEDWCTEEPNWYSYRDGRATIIEPDYWMPIEPPKEDE